MNDVQLYAAMKFPWIRDSKGMKALKETIEKGDKEKFYELLQKAFEPMDMLMKRYPLPEPVAKYAKSLVSKNHELLSGARENADQAFRSFAPDLEVDMEWMAAFRMVATTAQTLRDIDFTSTVKWIEQNHGEKIKMTSFGKDTTSTIDENRYTCGVPFLTRWLETNDLYSINDAINAMRVANMNKKADDAYTALQGSSPSTTTATGSTIPEIITAINSGVKTLIERNDEKGYGLTARSPVHLYYAMDHQDDILQAFAQVRQQGDGNKNIINWNVIPHGTFNSNWPAQFSSKNAVMLVLPQRQIKWVSFRNIEIQQSEDFSTHSVAVLAQEYWNKSVDDDQLQIVNLEA